MGDGLIDPRSVTGDAKRRLVSRGGRTLLITHRSARFPYSTFSPESFTMPPHFAISRCTIAASSKGDDPTGSIIWGLKRSRTSGSLMARAISDWIFSTMGRGVFAGAYAAYQAAAS